MSRRSLAGRAATIGAVPAGPRPTWSVMIPTYECGEYLGATIESVLRQASPPEAMEIVVMDDHSVQDDIAGVVADVGGGRVSFVRQPVNVGHVRNFNECLQRAHGQFVHLLHGDDVVRDGFYRVMERALLEHLDVGAAICRYVPIDHRGSVCGSEGPLLRDSAGVLDDWLRTIGRGQAVQPPALVVRRSVYERIGGFHDGIEGYGEDWELLVRIASCAPVWFEPATLAEYRVRPGSLSDPTRLKSNVDDMRRVFGLNERTLRAHLPGDEAEAITRDARRALAAALLRRGRRHMRRYSAKTQLRSAFEAVRLDPRPGTVAGGVGLLSAALARFLKARLTAPTARGIERLD